ncbi:hypothetical protein KRE40_16885 [Elizabethkingia meningoseptica]|uniref:Uncharacterized protein n=1 Tax=Elizabethkingia meningoseptica TaxID=238 RepID=A0A1V3U5G5_ELIME|nr:MULTISPECIES: hypothetical protein [Elizabethkingia]AQX06826.1 hypothetical protein BBD33_16850 [Elizabethkingia meningoseptica]AQX11080.1 hypothetical protein BBD35_01205 [Elizabethkingia meningoseptica]EJK5330394.1 hypothetical protein [Elizabethkingia meningoseptica]MBG0512407.1 hypothetical protein [Elizabethkingia meningoseptica]MDE5435769.1 hypothetical protein [Elizabethkingia meningoseptica]
MKRSLQTKYRKCKKRMYITPEIETLLVKMEQGIAAQSAVINIGGSQNIPEIEDWNNGGDIGNKDFDL